MPESIESKQDSSINISLESALQHNKLRYQEIIDNANDAFVGINTNGNITEWNKQAEIIFGWKKEEILTKKLAETIIPIQFRQLHERGMRRFLDTGIGPVLKQRIELSALHKDGHEFPIEITIWAEKTNTQDYNFFAFIHDISQRKNTEKIILDAHKKAEENQRHRAQAAEEHKQELETLVTNLCHETRNPLNGIIGNNDLLKNIVTTLETLTKADLVDMSQIAKQLTLAHTYLDNIGECTNHITNLTNDVLSLSKLESGTLELDIYVFNVQEILASTINIFSAKAQKKGLELKLIVPSEEILVKNDPLRLKQILINLVSNAIFFTTKGYVALTLEVETTACDEILLQLSVTDTGIGMDDFEIARLFQSFKQQYHKLSSKYGSSGLNLIISKNLIEAMCGGKLNVTSKKGKGTTFYFSMPCARPTLEEIAAFRTRSIIAEKPPDFIEKPPQNTLILLVEDNPINQRILSTMLSKLGYQYHQASDGKEAVQMFSKEKYDLIILDIEMPRMNGYKAAWIMRQQERILGKIATPIVALSGNIPENFKIKALNIGMNGYLTKPYTQSDIKDILKKWVRSDHSHTIEKAIPSVSGMGVFQAAANTQNYSMKTLVVSGYEQAQIDYLLQYYFGSNLKILISPSQEIQEANCNRLKPYLREIQSDKSSSNRLLIDWHIMPIQLTALSNQNKYWVILLINFDNNNQYNPTIYYLDPAGMIIPDYIVTVLTEVFTEVQKDEILVTSSRTSIGNPDCGPWIIEFAKFILHEGYLPAENFDIHAAWFKQNTRLISQSLTSSSDMQRERPERRFSIN